MTKETVKTKRNCEFMNWWPLLNAEMSKLHPGQQVGFRDARDNYDMGQSPETAAQELFVQWGELKMVTTIVCIAAGFVMTVFVLTIVDIWLTDVQSREVGKRLMPGDKGYLYPYHDL